MNGVRLVKRCAAPRPHRAATAQRALTRRPSGVEAQDRGAGPATRDEPRPAPVKRGTARGASRGAGRDGQRQRDERPRPRAAAVATAPPRRHLHRPGHRAVAGLRREGPRVARPGAGERRARLALRADRSRRPRRRCAPGRRTRPRPSSAAASRTRCGCVRRSAAGGSRRRSGRPARRRRAVRRRRRPSRAPCPAGGDAGGGDDGEGGDAPGAHGRRLPGDRWRYASTDLTAAAIRSSLGIAASSRFLA